jgi:hypothetical protein
MVSLILRSLVRFHGWYWKWPKLHIIWPGSIHQWISLYCHIFGVCDYRWGMDWISDLLTTCMHHSRLHFTDHWHTQTSVLSLLQSPLAISWQQILPREILHLPTLRSSCHSCPCRTLVNWQLSWLGPRLEAILHHPPSLLFIGWLSLITDNWTVSLTNQLLHVTSLNWTADNWLQLSWWPSYTTSGWTQQKTPPLTIILLLSWAVA